MSLLKVNRWWQGLERLLVRFLWKNMVQDKGTIIDPALRLPATAK